MRAASQLAAAVDDAEFGAACDKAFARGQAALDRWQWQENGTASHFSYGIGAGWPNVTQAENTSLMVDTLYAQVLGYSLGLGSLISSEEKIKAHLVTENAWADTPAGMTVLQHGPNKADGEAYGTGAIWQGGSPNWGSLNIHLGMDVDAALAQQPRKSLDFWRSSVSDLWNVAGIASARPDGDAFPSITSHYGFHMVFWHLPLAISGQQADLGAENSSLTFAPKVQAPFSLPILLVGVLGSVRADKKQDGMKYTVELTIGDLRVESLSVDGSTYPGAVDISAEGTNSVSWTHKVRTRLKADDSRGPMNAKDFGARGDCVHPGDYTSGCLDCVVCDTDDAPALQRAIDAAQLAGRSLFIPAGVYRVNTTLLIRCTGARDPIEDNSPNPMCDGVLNATHRYHPLRLVGEGMESTMIQAGRAMPAVLELEAPAITRGAATNGFTHNVSGMHAIEHIHFHANSLANSSLMSFGVIRSRFANLAATSALQYGLSLHNGFINTIDGCKMHSNREAGVFVSENDNAIEIANSEPSGNLGHGIVIFGGAQISIHRNTIEGNGGAGILASGAEALDVTANYFEANTSPSVFSGNPNHEHGFVLRPAVTGVPGADAITLNADIVLNGADSWDEYGAADPNRGVRISSN